MADWAKLCNLPVNNEIDIIALVYLRDLDM